MKELVILSGKGGTGKTSMVGALAALAENKVLVDCDVDAANLYLLTDPEIESAHEFSGGSKAVIDQDKCTSCGVCHEQCRFEAVIVDESNPDLPLAEYSIDPLACEGCGVCSRVCIDDAITMKPTVNGMWYRSRTRFGCLVHGRLGIAESNSGRMVTLLRNTARGVAEENGCGLVIIDGPPGIGCPAIAALTGADYVLIVTEPGLSAYHDLERLAALIRHFDIPAGICINKYDINPEITNRIVAFAEDHGFDLPGKLKYDETMTRAQVAGKTVIEYSNGESAEALKSIWREVKNRMNAADPVRIKSDVKKSPGT